MHRLVRKLRREHSAPNHRHTTISAEEAMRQLCLQRALERQEAQRWVGVEPATVVDPFAPTWPPFYPTTTTPQAVAFGPTAFGIPQMPMAMMVPPWSLSSPQLVRPPQQFVEEEEVLPANDNDSNEEAELQRAMEESMREAEERKRKEDEEERRVMQRLRELEEKERLRAELQQRQQQRMEVDDEVLQRLEAEEDARRAALEEAKQVQLALQMSLAAQRQQQQYQQQWLRAEGNAPEDVQEDEEVVDDEELADALRLSRLVCKSPEERKREEEAIYRAALIHEQNREFEESRHQDLMKEEAHREVQRERERIRSLLQEARHKEASLVAEPSAASTAGATELVVRMPDGRRVRRRFPVDAALQSIKDWIDVELAKAHELELKSPATEDEKAQKDDEDGDDEDGEDSEVTNAGSFLVGGYDLVTDFPRRVFTNLHETASEAGLSPRALLNLSKH